MTGLRKRHLFVAALLVSQVLVSLICGMVFASTPRENYIFPGVFIGGSDVGEMSKEQAVQLLEQQVAEKMANGHLTLQYKNKQWSLSYRQLGVRFRIRESVDSVLEMSRSNSALVRSLMMFRVRFRRLDLPLQFDVDEARFADAMSGVVSDVTVQASDAAIALQEGRIVLVRETIGKKLAIQTNSTKILEAIGRLSTSPVNLEVSEIRPAITSSDLKNIKDSLGIGITTFPRSEKEAVSNIYAIVRRLDGYLIRPGQVFSFNSLVGSKITERRYLEPSITEGRLSGESGGAGPRVASTLYQAALYSGLHITERHAMLSSPDYAPLGQDAAVTHGGMDLKFANDTSYPVYIKAAVHNNRIVINILGIKPEGQTVQIVSMGNPVETQDGSKWRRVRVSRVYYLLGVEKKREIISEDRYQISE